MFLTLAKEAYDDFKRYRRDKDYNSTKYRLVRQGQMHTISSQDMQVVHSPGRSETSSNFTPNNEYPQT
jgi:hypothetical protein